MRIHRLRRVLGRLNCRLRHLRTSWVGNVVAGWNTKRTIGIGKVELAREILSASASGRGSTIGKTKKGKCRLGHWPR